MFRILLLVFITSILVSCDSPTNIDLQDENPASQGFDLLGSDPKAIALADSVMLAIGGRKAWDETDMLKWNFFGARRHFWNKKTGDLVIEGLKDSFVIHMNLIEMTGTVNLKNNELTKQDSLNKYIQKGKEMWINDSYWLFLPFKLKDSGVTLKYLNRDTTSFGEMAEKISLTFEEVGVTPENKYIIYIDPSSYLITQWDFYSKVGDEEARFSTPWLDYEEYGKIMLSSSRGPNYTIGEIAVGEKAKNSAAQ